jgi:hypothetical protein
MDSNEIIRPHCWLVKFFNTPFDTKFFIIFPDLCVFFISCYSDPTVKQRVDLFSVVYIWTGLRFSSFLIFHSSTVLGDGWSFQWRWKISHGSPNLSPQTG